LINTASSSTKSNLREAAYKTYCVAVVPKVAYTRMALYWVNMPAEKLVDDKQFAAALTEVLCDPLQEELWISDLDQRVDWTAKWRKLGYRFWSEKQFAAGVTDNLAHTVTEALKLLKLPSGCKVASGTGYLFSGKPGATGATETAADSFETIVEVDEASKYKRYHPVVERWRTHDISGAAKADFFAFPDVALPSAPPVAPVSLELSDEDLIELSRQKLLALTLEEMHAVRDYFRNPSIIADRKKHNLGVDPTDVELEVIAQTWSEHCKHKIFNATIEYSEVKAGVEGALNEIKINSLYKTYIQGPTKELAKKRTDLLSVFKDNSGVVRWDDTTAVCFKVETHNSPSALEPYGGALTGILGVNRDILGTGLGAKPIFNTDVFCFAYPHGDLPQRPKLLPAATILNGVRKGVEDGGNKSGIPTVNGGIFFDPAYRAKPLVFCGTGGILPLSVHGRVAYEKHTTCGDTIVMAGGRVGKDGVHGATFSSESMHEGSPVSAVQIGDPFTQKRLLDFVIEARDANLITGLTDNGAGGLSSSIGEMATITNGATLVLDDVPTKYPGLADWEIVVSESQERMTLSTRDMDKLSALATKHNVEVTAVGTFDDAGYFKIVRDGQVNCLLGLDFLHDGCPLLQLQAQWAVPEVVNNFGDAPEDLGAALLKLLSHPNICSREDVIRQYDHEVQGASVIKPLMGKHQNAPCDAAVITPIYGDKVGLVVSNGMTPKLSEFDTYLMAACAVDEAVRNAVCVGADPKTISLLDNFCWPDPVVSAKNPLGHYKLAQLVRACMGLRDAVMAFEAPLISGKDSMKNDFDDGVIRLSIPPTLLVSGIGRVPDIATCVSMEFKNAGDSVYLLRAGNVGLAGSHYEEISGWKSNNKPSFNLSRAASLYSNLHHAISQGLVQSAHDSSDGGLAVAVAEGIVASRLGVTLYTDALTAMTPVDCSGTGMELHALHDTTTVDTRFDVILFGEGPANIIVSVKAADKAAFEKLFAADSITLIGEVTGDGHLKLAKSTSTSSTRTPAHNKDVRLALDVDQLAQAWTTKLPFD
jgi:phosphoribosylformylglycinamidine synthase II